MTWHCEGCGDEKDGEPSYTETHEGHDERVKLWFCGDCS